MTLLATEQAGNEEGDREDDRLAECNRCAFWVSRGTARRGGGPVVMLLQHYEVAHPETYRRDGPLEWKE